ncbi:MAG: PKD domain-containing protein [Phycisphaerae bacterium]
MHLKIATALALALCAGCPQYRDPTVPGQVRHLTEPLHGQEYLLYVPTNYQPDRQWALIVVCHGTRWFDTAKRQIGDWAKLAEERQFIVAAPRLQGVNGMITPAVPKQLELQRRDARHILSCVGHIQGAYNIAPDKIFLTGWSAGNFAVLATGLNHPEVFRALAVLQGNFKEEYLSDVASRIDPYQPVYVLYGSTDVITGRHGHRCVEWLHEHGAALTEDEIAGAHKNHPKRAYRFFERVVRKVPWLHIQATHGGADDPLTVRFDIRASFKPQRYRWSFGDKSESPIAKPTHTFDKPGQYTVTLDATNPDGTLVRRAVEVNVGQ